MSPSLRILVALPLLLTAASPALSQGSGTISGSALDNETRIGLANVVVSCRPGKSTVTDAHGRFSFEKRRPGRYEIRCEGAKGYALSTKELRRLVVVSEKGAQLTVDFLLHRSESVRGTLVDSSGNPVSNAEVRGRWPGPDIVTTTDTGGDFVLDGFLPWSNVTISARTDTLIADDIRHEVPEGGSDDFIVTAHRAASIQGRITDKNGKALKKVKLKWSRHTNNTNHSFPPVQTDDEGFFILEGLLPAKYTFSVQPKEGRTRVILRHTFQEGETKKNVELVYAPSSGPKISGRVVDARGNPLSGVTFSVMGIETQTGAVTNKKGTFVVHDLPEGMYQLAYFEYKGQMYHEGVRVRTGDSGVKIELKPRPRRPQGRASGPVSGRLFDAVTERPITRFSYRLKKGIYKEIDPNAQDQSGSQYEGFFDSGDWKRVEHPHGFFEFSTYAAGDHSLAVRAEGYATFTRVVAAKENNIDIGLTPELRAEGVVRDPAGNPLLGAQIILGAANWYPPVKPIREHESRTDADGQFTIGGLSTGETTITAWHEDWGSTTKTVHLTEPITNVDFAMPMTGTLAGFVRLDGEPIRDFGIWVYRVEGDVLRYAGAPRMNEGNRYELKRFMPGRLKVHIQLDPRNLENVPSLAATKFVDIEPGQTAELLFELESPDQ